MIIVLKPNISKKDEAAVLTRLGSDSFTLDAPRAGASTLRIHFTPYWALQNGHGCVRRAPGDWTELQARGAGSFHVVIDFSLAREKTRSNADWAASSPSALPT